MAQLSFAPGVQANDLTPHRVIFLTWGLAVGLRFMMDARKGGGSWPCPGRFWRISALYIMLSLLAEIRPELAMMLGLGFLVAFMGKEAAATIPQTGTYFGVKVK